LPITRRLSLEPGHRTSAKVPALFDPELRAMRRDRAARVGPEMFLLERAFADCLERISLFNRTFEHALLIGCPDPGWPERLHERAAEVEVVEPGAEFARRAGGQTILEEQWSAPADSFDLVLAVGTLDTVNELPAALQAIRGSMRSNALLVGAIPGGDTLPQVRAAMRAADSVTGEASAHVHPRIEASALAALLTATGFARPVIDVDRVEIAYRSFEQLVADLRAMAATNLLSARSRRPLNRAAAVAAAQSFTAAGDGERTFETVEILHFAAWTADG
jgi:SAM-dependent methyltransferase